METFLSNLVDILNEEIALHEELLRLFEEETRNVGQISGSALLRIQSSKMRCSRKIVRFEQQRMEVVEKLAVFWEIEGVPLTLSMIIAKVPQDFSSSLQTCFDSLQSLVKEIQKISSLCERLSEARLDAIETSLNFLNTLKKSQQLYSGEGRLQEHTNTISRMSI